MSEAAPALKQDQPDEDHYRALCAERGWAPIAGGSPELDEEQAGGGLTPPEAPEAKTPDTPDGEEESFPDFDLSEVPEGLRADAERYAQEVKKHFQGDYTKKTQSLAEERREAEQARQIMDALKNPQVAPAVLAQLGYDERKMLELYGYQPEEEEPEFGEDDPDERIGRLEQTLAQREQADQQARQEEAVSDYIAEQIEALEGKEKREFDAEEHQLLDVYARSNPTPEGYPDVEGAFNLLSGIVSSRQKALLDPKRNTPRPPGGGKPGSRQVDLSKESREERVARMAQAADEARGSVAA